MQQYIRPLEQELAVLIEYRDSVLSLFPNDKDTVAEFQEQIDEMQAAIDELKG